MSELLLFNLVPAHLRERVGHTAAAITALLIITPLDAYLSLTAKIALESTLGLVIYPATALLFIWSLSVLFQITLAFLGLIWIAIVPIGVLGYMGIIPDYMSVGPHAEVAGFVETPFRFV